MRRSRSSVQSSPAPCAANALAGLPQAGGDTAVGTSGGKADFPQAGPLAERQAEPPALDRIGDKGSFLRHDHGQEAEAQAPLRT